jgi:YndJ-like protein
MEDLRVVASSHRRVKLEQPLIAAMPKLSLSHASAILGAFAWIVLLAAPLPIDRSLESIVRLLLLAVLVITPLALPLAAPPAPARYARLAHRAATIAQPFAAALVVLAFYQAAGPAVALPAAAWLMPTGLAALTGLLRLLARRNARADELCIDAGLIYLPVGAVWLLFNRMNLNSLGFGETIVLLTAVHFHYAGFAAPILAGLLGRQLAGARPTAWPLFRLVAAGVIAGIALVAAGITLARYTPLVEVAAALLFAASMLGLAVLTLRIGPRSTIGWSARTLLALSAASLFVTMLLAASYALGQFLGTPIVGLPRMVQIHGWLNAIGFALCGLLAWTIENRIKLSVVNFQLSEENLEADN